MEASCFWCRPRSSAPTGAIDCLHPWEPTPEPACRARAAVARVPLSCALIGGGQRQHAGFRKARSGNHQAHRQGGGGETAGYRDRGYSVSIELPCILQFGIQRLVRAFALYGRVASILRGILRRVGKTTRSTSVKESSIVRRSSSSLQSERT